MPATMMLANKENAVLHAPGHGKANPKTPGPAKMAAKTPFKIPLNDENTTLLAKTGKKTAFVGRDLPQFVTPVGPRRQALAGKTTNAKAPALAPSIQQGKTGQSKDCVSKPRRTHLILSQQLETEVSTAAEDDVPEIEYMAPVPPEIPSVPDGFEEPDYGLLKKNYMKNCHRAYLAGLDQDGKTEIQRQMEKTLRLLEDDLNAETEEAICNAKGIPKSGGALPPPPPKTSVSAREARITAAVKGMGQVKHSTSRPPPTRQPLNARTTSRPASAASATRPASSSVSATRPTSSHQRQAVNTIDSRKAVEALSQRPSRPASSASCHSRSASSAREPSRKPSHSRSGSVVTKNTIGYSIGQNLRGNVKKTVSRAKLESTLDAMERIQREDDEAEARFVAHIPEGVDDDGIIVDFPSPSIEGDDDGDEEFFMTMPE